MQKWLARLAFSFIVIAAVLAWEGHKARKRGVDPTWRYALAAVFGAMGISGVRQRHQR